MLENIPVQYLWICVGILVMLMELFIPGFIICFFGLGAVLTGLILTIFNLSLNLQLIIFIIMSFATLIAFRRYAQGYFKGKISAVSIQYAQMEDYGGQTAIVTEDIIPNTPKGRVEFRGTSWNADAEVEIKKGTKVTIITRQDLTLKVKF